MHWSGGAACAGDFAHAAFRGGMFSNRRSVEFVTGGGGGGALGGEFHRSQIHTVHAQSLEIFALRTPYLFATTTLFFLSLFGYHLLRPPTIKDGLRAKTAAGVVRPSVRLAAQPSIPWPRARLPEKMKSCGCRGIIIVSKIKKGQSLGFLRLVVFSRFSWIQ